MGESTKAVAALFLIIGSIVAVFAWLEDGTGPWAWGFRIGAPAIAVLSVALILALHFRSDVEPDYLREIGGKYFNRDGFCFLLKMENHQGIAFMEAYFQNQYDSPSVGRIAVRPARGFWMNRPKFEAITFEIECQPAAFGVARVAVPVPTDLQGKKKAFEVGASVTYPEGKGNRLRYFDGVFLRTNSKFDNAFKTAAIVTSVATLSVPALTLVRPVTTKIEFPSNVHEDLPGNLAPQLSTLWKFGDPPLEPNGNLADKM